MFSAPLSIIPCVLDPAIVTLAASLCQLQRLGVTHSAASLLLLLVFSQSLLISIRFHFITHPHQLLQSLVCCPQSRLSNTSLHPWCDSLLMLFSLSLSLFSGMLILPKAKLLHLFCTSFFHIPFFQLPYYFSYFDIKY